MAVQDAIIKQISGSYPLTQVLCLRSVITAPILLALVQHEIGWRAIFALPPGLLTLRSVIMLLAYTAYYMTFPALPLARAVALYFTVPLGDENRRTEAGMI